VQFPGIQLASYEYEGIFLLGFSTIIVIVVVAGGISINSCCAWRIFYRLTKTKDVIFVHQLLENSGGGIFNNNNINNNSFVVQQ